MPESVDTPLPNVKRITLGGSDVATEVELPEASGIVSLHFISNDGKAAFVGVDLDPIFVDYATIPADTWVELRWKPGVQNNTGRTSIFLASATGSTVVEVLVQG